MSDYTFQCDHGVVLATPGGSFIFRANRGHSLEDLQTAVALELIRVRKELADIITAEPKP